MAIEWMDNFSLYGLDRNLMLNGAWAEVVSGSNPAQTTDLVEDPDPNITTTVLRLGKENSIIQFQNYARRVFGSSIETAGVAMRVWLEALPNDSRQSMIIAGFRDNTNAGLVSVVVGPTGNLIVRQGAPTSVTNLFTGTILAQTTGPVITANAWQHVEIKVVFSGTVGTVEIRVEGVTVLTATNLNTSPTGNNAASIQVHNYLAATPSGPPNPWFFYVKDFVAWNASGSLNNNFLGSVVVYSLLPDGDTSLNWTPSSGSNGWSILDNRPPNDTIFLSASNAPPAAYQGTLTNLPVDVTSVKGIQTTVRATKVDGGDGNLQISMVSGASTANGANRPITGAFTYWNDIFEQDPATSAAWTPSGVNAAQIKMNRTV